MTVHHKTFDPKSAISQKTIFFAGVAILWTRPPTDQHLRAKLELEFAMLRELKEVLHDFSGLLAGIFLVAAGVALVNGRVATALWSLGLSAACRLIYSLFRSPGPHAKVDVSFVKAMMLLSVTSGLLLTPIAVATGQFGQALHLLGMTGVFGCTWAFLRRYELSGIVGADRHGLPVTKTAHVPRRSEELAESTDHRRGKDEATHCHARLAKPEEVLKLLNSEG